MLLIFSLGTVNSLLKYRSIAATVFPLSHMEIAWISNRNGLCSDLCAVNSEGNCNGRGMGGTCKVNGLKQIIILNDRI